MIVEIIPITMVMMMVMTLLKETTVIARVPLTMFVEKNHENSELQASA